MSAINFGGTFDVIFNPPFSWPVLRMTFDVAGPEASAFIKWNDERVAIIPRVRVNGSLYPPLP
jgi:hypothetical protein